MLAGMLPGADRDGLATRLATLRLGPSRARSLRDYLSAHPDAVSSGRSDGPSAWLALLGVLAVDHPQVRLACCVGCGEVKTLPYRLGDGRACKRCYAGQHLETCVRCGRVGRPTVREAGGVVCARCYIADPDTWEQCFGAGRPGTSPIGSRATRCVSLAARAAPRRAARVAEIGLSTPIPSAGRCVTGAIASPVALNARRVAALCISGSATPTPGLRCARPAGLHHRPPVCVVGRSSFAGGVCALVGRFVRAAGRGPGLGGSVRCAAACSGSIPGCRWVMPAVPVTPRSVGGRATAPAARPSAR